MNKHALILNLILSLILFFGNGFLGKLKARTKGVFGYDSFGFNNISEANFADHFFQKIVHPAIFIAITAAILQHFALAHLAQELWLVVPFYWVLRLLYIFLRNIAPFTNWKYELTSLVISLVLGEGTLFLILRPLLDNNQPVFIEVTEFRDAFWFAALSYIAKITWDISKASLSGYSVFPAEKRAQTIISRYTGFKQAYGAEINVILREHYSFDENDLKEHFLCLLYAVMIYEDYCRPRAIRYAEYAAKLFRPHAVMSLGIMQVQTNRFIGDRCSIRLAIEKLYNAFSNQSGYYRINHALRDYNADKSYPSEVFTIYLVLVRHQGLSLLP